MVDYSKWDNIDVSDDDNDNNESSKLPKVTKFDKAGKFHIGPQGSTFFDNDDDFNKFQSNNTTNDSNNRKVNDNSEIDNDIRSIWSKNGSILEKYIWCQTKKEITIRVALKNNVKAGDIKINLDDKKLTIITKDNNEIISGILSNEIIKNSDDEDSIDWEILSIKQQNFILNGIDNFTRILEVTLKKKTPFADAIIWWSKVFENEPEIDVTKIEERQINSTFQQNWNEAHKLFKEKIANNTKTTIDIDDDDENK